MTCDSRISPVTGILATGTLRIFPLQKKYRPKATHRRGRREHATPFAQNRDSQKSWRPNISSTIITTTTTTLDVLFVGCAKLQCDRSRATRPQLATTTQRSAMRVCPALNTEQQHIPAPASG